ncbi:MAG TPA: ComEA family DNA-binding protein [Gaiellaceae bacterium]|nr:ComEA family DNA-binding protein [Gaiellaceae bacterium]
MRMPSISRGRALAYVVVLLAVLVLAGRFALGSAQTRSAAHPAPDGPAMQLQAEEPPARDVLVHVVGAVVRPGLYRLPEGSRVDDALTEAGGPKPKAALELLNLAAPVGDGQQVVVPAKGAAAAAAGGTAGVPGSTLGVPQGKVHLNSASLEELDTLPGVGPVTAQRILDYRTENGAFQSVEELDAVSGIGPARLEQLLPLVDL